MKKNKVTNSKEHTATFGVVDDNGCTPMEDMMQSGTRHTSDYSVQANDNWVARANMKPKVVTRVQHAG